MDEVKRLYISLLGVEEECALKPHLGNTLEETHVETFKHDDSSSCIRYFW